MSSVLNVNLRFQNHFFSYLLNVNENWKAVSSDSFVLRGTGVALDDQQHEDNMGVNYLSYRIKHVRLRGNYFAYHNDRFRGVKDNLVVVLYKVPAKYETGIVQPAATTYGFLTLKDYFLYSTPRSVLSWSVYTPSIVRLNDHYHAFDVSLSCDREFVLGPNDLLCCNLLFSYNEIYNASNPKIDITAKIYYDLN